MWYHSWQYYYWCLLLFHVGYPEKLRLPYNITSSKIKSTYNAHCVQCHTWFTRIKVIEFSTQPALTFLFLLIYYWDGVHPIHIHITAGFIIFWCCFCFNAGGICSAEYDENVEYSTSVYFSRCNLIRQCGRKIFTQKISTKTMHTKKEHYQYSLYIASNKAKPSKTQTGQT